MATRPPRIITVSIPKHRYITPRPNIRFYRRKQHPAQRCRLRRTSPEETLVDLISQTADITKIIGLLTTAIRVGIHPTRISKAVRMRDYFPKTRLVRELLGEVENGIESP